MRRSSLAAPVLVVRLLAALLLATSVLSFASATTYRELSLDQLISRAEVGFFGRVTEISVIVQGQEPYTQVRFEVLRALTGDDTPAALTLTFYGGTLPNGRSLTVEGMPTFSRGDEVIVMAYNAPYYSPIVGFSQGLWRATPNGFRDLSGQLLSLNGAGRLVRGGQGSEQAAVLDELETRLGATP